MRNIVPEPTPERCPPRTCDIAPYSPCLNNGICTEVTGADNLTFSCSCQNDFFGEGCQFFDECSSEPCLNGGQCFVDLTSMNQFTCMCPNRFEGDRCERMVSPCQSSPCSNDGNCIDSNDGKFVCDCAPGFTGLLCDVDIDDCNPNVCENGGLCTDIINGFTCSCQPGFSGPICSIQVLFCSSDACLNGGTCLEDEHGFVCDCPSGYTGLQCSQDIDECITDPCQNGATCSNSLGNFICFCPPGFSGLTCGDTINFCSNTPCSSNGLCESLTTGFRCVCNSGFTGDLCNVDIDECDPDPCLNGGTCMQGVGFFMCMCPPGLTGALCDINVNECEPIPCENGGTCTDELGGFSCECSSGFTGSTCSEQVDFCIGQICYNGGNCSSIGGTFICSCPDGWMGNRCQYADSVVPKLDSCGFTMASDMLADAGLVENSEALPISNGSPSVSFQYNLANARGIYFSGWIWQQSGTNSVLFSFTDDSLTVAGQFISDMPKQELRFLYSTLTNEEVLNVIFSDVPLRANTWMHVALAVFNNNSIIINIDGTFTNRSRLQVLGASNSEASIFFEVPSVVIINIASGVTALSSQDSAQAFSGLVRGIAINKIINTSDTFSIQSLQNCTLNCVSGSSFCTANGQCQDLFGRDRRCICPFGLTGLSCQQVQDRLSFDGSSFVLFNEPTNFGSLQFSFKTDQSQGHLYSHTRPLTQTNLRLQDNRTISISRLQCNGVTETQAISSQQVDLNNFQYHSLLVSNTVQLNEKSEVELPTLNTPSCNATFNPSIMLGGTPDSSGSNFQGCMRDILYNGVQFDASLLRLSEGAQFGCTRDTAQFYFFSYLELPQFISRLSQTISLDFSTHSPSGLLYFSRRVPDDATGSMPNDFVAIHLEAGQAVFTFNLGEQNQNVILKSSSLVNDGQWHRVTAVQNGTLASLYLDSVLIEAQSMGPLMLLDTTGSVFLGGVPSRDRITTFNAYTGFDGCVRDLEQNGVAVDMQSYMALSNIRFGVCN